MRSKYEYPQPRKDSISSDENRDIARRALVRKVQREEKRLRSMIYSADLHRAEHAKALFQMQKFVRQRTLLLADIDEHRYSVSPVESRQALARLIGMATPRATRLKGMSVVSQRRASTKVEITENV